MTAPSRVAADVAPPVRGPAAIAMLCLRCLAVLTTVNLAAGAVLAVADPDQAGVMVVALVAPFVVAVPVALVGYPAGLLTAWLLRAVGREWVHVAVFALVGAGLAALLLAVGDAPWPPAFGAVEGVVGAGGARWWSGWAHRRAARRGPRRPRPEPEDAIIDAQLAAGSPGDRRPASE